MQRTEEITGRSAQLLSIERQQKRKEFAEHLKQFRVSSSTFCAVTCHVRSDCGSSQQACCRRIVTLCRVACVQHEVDKLQYHEQKVLALKSEQLKTERQKEQK